ncbi:MAG: LCP family protein [Schaedlerella sp.]|nr:LCP family protein [Schaedlerella sp.]
MAKVGGATYKTDNMIVVVKKSDGAENILDAADYRFGIQTSLDQENNNLMIEEIESIIGKAIFKVEHETLVEEAEALLDGRVRAAIYNEAFMEIIEESIEGYSNKIKIIHQYGIETKIEEEEKDIEKPFNVYISGIDVAGEITTNSRSDVNIIMTVNPGTHQILLTTTPRDYYVKIPEISDDQKDKLTHAGIYGVDISMDTLEALYDINISYYARVNFTSLMKIVDALGGIDVYSEHAFDTGKYSFVQGVNHMNGEQALAFSRERYSFEDGDNQRGKNQEAVLKAILEKAMSPAILTSAGQIIASVSDSVETNMTQEEMVKLINMQLDSGARWSIDMTSATGIGDNQPCYSSGTEILCVMQPDAVSVNSVRAKMQDVLQAESMRINK